MTVINIYHVIAEGGWTLVHKSNRIKMKNNLAKLLQIWLLQLLATFF